MEDIDGFKAVLLSQFVVVGIMRRGHLQTASPELPVHIVIQNNGNVTISHGHTSSFSMQVGISLVVGMNTNRCITHDCLWTGGCNGQIFTRSVYNFIPHIIKFTVLLSVDDFFIAQCSLRSWVPVNHALSSVYKSLIVQVNKSIDYTIVVFLVHREARA